MSLSSENRRMTKTAAANKTSEMRIFLMPKLYRIFPTQNLPQVLSLREMIRRYFHPDGLIPPASQTANHRDIIEKLQNGSDQGGNVGEGSRIKHITDSALFIRSRDNA